MIPRPTDIAAGEHLKNTIVEIFSSDLNEDCCDKHFDGPIVCLFCAESFENNEAYNQHIYESYECRENPERLSTGFIDKKSNNTPTINLSHLNQDEFCSNDIFPSTSSQDSPLTVTKNKSELKTFGGEVVIPDYIGELNNLQSIQDLLRNKICFFLFTEDQVIDGSLNEDPHTIFISDTSSDSEQFDKRSSTTVGHVFFDNGHNSSRYITVNNVFKRYS